MEAMAAKRAPDTRRPPPRKAVIFLQRLPVYANNDDLGEKMSLTQFFYVPGIICLARPT